MFDFHRLDSRISHISRNSRNQMSPLIHHTHRPRPIYDDESDQFGDPDSSYISNHAGWVDPAEERKATRSFCIQPHEGDTLVRGESMMLQIDTGEISILSCTICYGKDFEGIKICRHCSSHACNSCWDRVLSDKGKCPYCRKRVRSKDLIVNRLAAELKSVELSDKEASKVLKNCQFHDQNGSFFCETCFTFICITCITEGTHTGHDVCDIDKRPELKAHYSRIQKTKNDINRTSESLNTAISQKIKYFSSEDAELSKIAKELKKSVLSKINGCLGKHLKVKSDYQEAMEEAKKDLKILEIVKKEYIMSSQVVRAPEDIKDNICKYLQEKGAKKLSKLLMQKTDSFPELEELENAYNLDHGDKKHENFLLKFNKSLSDILTNPK